MRVFLLFRDRDFDPEQALAPNGETLAQDLELATLFDAMANGEPFLLDVAKRAVLSELSCDVATIHYRQEIIRDCLKNRSIVRAMYRLAEDTLEKERRQYYFGSLSAYPSAILNGSVAVLERLLKVLHELVRIGADHGGQFASEGFTRFFKMIEEELDEAYFKLITSHLKELRFRHGVLISATLGKGNKGIDYVLHKPEHKTWRRLRRVLGREPPTYEFHLHPRDEAGAQALSELRDHGIALVADTLRRSTEHVLSFFRALKTELAFHVGTINLHERLSDKGEPLCFPEPVNADERRLSFRGLYDVCLALSIDARVTGNALDGDGKQLVLITGANQGGKSTFLRSLGLAQLMMQCGMLVAAETFSATIRDRLFTHYKREEDPGMEMGKFEEELNRMSEILDHVTVRSMVLFNESFASTNEREGSEIAMQIISGLLEKGVKIGFVTHMHALAEGFYEKHMALAIFLRAERKDDGERTFKLIEAEPLQTSYGEDLYWEVFGEAIGAHTASPTPPDHSIDRTPADKTPADKTLEPSP